MTTPQHPYTNPLPYTTTTWRECVIWCACEGGGVRAVNAKVLGALAVHRGLGVLSNRFVLTHIPTGKFIRYYGAEWYVRQLAERLTALGDWNTRAVGKLKRLREAM